MPRRLTHEQHVAAIAEKNPNVEVLGKIINDRTKVLCRCKVCEHRWEVTPHNLKQGEGCPRCAGNLKLSHKEQVAAILHVNPNIEILEEIVNNSTKVLCRCEVCNHVWSVTPNNLKNGNGCPKCYNLRRGKSSLIPHVEQIKEIKKKNPNIEILEEIIGNKKKVLVNCFICSHKWRVRPDDLKQGGGCPRCAKFGFLAHDYGELYIMVDDLEVPTIMKIGVSVRVEGRKKQIVRSLRKADVGISNLYIIRVWGGLTEDLRKMEKALHQTFAEYKASFSAKFDGCNEIFLYRAEVFDVVEKMYKEISKNLDTKPEPVYTKPEE